jgi:hypothetical protein
LHQTVTLLRGGQEVIETIQEKIEDGRCSRKDEGQPEKYVGLSK